MNYHYNTTMLPRSQCLRICLSCWRNVPTQLNTSTFSRNLLCSNRCGLRWNQAESVTVMDYSTTKPEEFDISKNPYFDKYKQKLAEKQDESPEEFQSRLENLKDKKVEAVEQRKMEIEEAKKEIEKAKKEIPKPTNVESPAGAGSWPPRSLDDVLKVDLIKDKSADEIRKIWSGYFSQKDCIFGVVEPKNYNSLVTKSQSCPLFIYPLPKGDGYEYYFSQIHGKDVYFTPLGMYQLLKENAPPCLTVAHFPELADDKEIVLLAGQYDSNIIDKQEAVALVFQMSAYYDPGEEERFNLVKKFNLKPEQFEHHDVIDEFKKLKLALLS